MRWSALQPFDPADPRWPRPESLQISLRALDPDDARRRVHGAYPSEPFGTPGQPLPNRGAGSFRDDPDAFVIAETETPPAPQE